MIEWENKDIGFFYGLSNIVVSNNYGALKQTSYLILLLLFWSLPYAYVTAQDDHNEEGHHHKNEISVAVGIVPLVAEDKLTGGLHFHYIRGIGEEHRFGLGIGLETIFDEHKHYTVSIVFNYRIVSALVLGYAPGLLMRKEGDQTLYQLAHHIELAYEFELGEFHIGPVVELGIEVGGIHYMGGVHFGIEF